VGNKLLKPKLVKGFGRWRSVATQAKHAKASMSLEERFKAEAKEREQLAVKLSKISREYADQRQLDEIALAEARKAAKEAQEQLNALTSEVATEKKGNTLKATEIDMKSADLEKAKRDAKAAAELLAEQQKHAADHLKRQLEQTRGTLDKELSGARGEIRSLKGQIADLEAEIMRWKTREANRPAAAPAPPKTAAPEAEDDEKKSRQKKGILGDVDFDEDKPLGEQIKAALQQHAIRVLDLFREWDKNGDGEISKKEFRDAMPLLGMDLPTKAIDELFDQYDPDKSGVMEFAELQRMLRKPAPALGGWGKAKAGAGAAAKLKGLTAKKG